MNKYDVIIIGAGPAGIAAAVYLQRANLKTAIIEKGAPGGKMVTTAWIENYPGYKKIDGPGLSMNMFEQLMESGSEYIAKMASKIKKDKNYRIVQTNDGEEYIAKAIIIATGTENKKLDIPGEKEFTNKGVSYCAICDGTFFKNKDVAVIGSGNSAIEESIYLSEICSNVHLFIRNDKIKADESATNELMKLSNVHINYNSSLIAIKGDESVKSIDIINNLTKQKSNLNVSGVFPFVGLIPLVFDLGDLDIKRSKLNFLLVDETFKTNVDGIYAIGDVIDKKYRQISTAVSDGTIAALSIKTYISSNKELF